MTYARLITALLLVALTSGCGVALYAPPNIPTTGEVHRPVRGAGTAPPAAVAKAQPLTEEVLSPDEKTSIEQAADDGGAEDTQVIYETTVMMRCQQAKLGNGTSVEECAKSLALIEANGPITELCSATIEALGSPGCIEWMRLIKPSDAPDSPFNKFGGGRRSGQNVTINNNIRPFNVGEINRWDGYGTTQ